MRADERSQPTHDSPATVVRLRPCIEPPATRPWPTLTNSPNTVQYLHQLVPNRTTCCTAAARFRFSYGSKSCSCGATTVHRSVYLDCRNLVLRCLRHSFALGRWQPNYAEQKLGKGTDGGDGRMYSVISAVARWPSSSMAGFTSIITPASGCAASPRAYCCSGWRLFEVVSTPVSGLAFGYEHDRFLGQFPGLCHGMRVRTDGICLSRPACDGLVVVSTGGLTRQASIVQAGEAMPVPRRLLMFVSAAFIEGYISPSGAPTGRRPRWRRFRRAADVLLRDSGHADFGPLSAPSGDGT